MKNKTKWLIFFLFTSYIFTENLLAGEDWVLVRNEGDIRIFLRQQQNSLLKEFKGVAMIKAPLHNAVQLMLDIDAATSWMHNMVTYKVINKISDREKYTYTVVDFPWPVKDRDCLVYSKILQDKNSKIVTIELAGHSDYDSENKNFVPMKNFQGIWQFTPLDNGYVEVVYQAATDPGGEIPAWMVNMQIVDIPYFTLKNFRIFVITEKYDKELNWLDE